MLRIRQALLFAALTLLGAGAHAGLILTLQDDSGASAVATDADDGVVDGVVSFAGPVGNWTTNVSTGFTNPTIGTAQRQEMDLNSVNVSGGTGTITITLTRTGLTSSPANWLNAVGGTTDGSISFFTLLNGSAISSFSTTSTGAFANMDSGSFSPGTPYSLSLVGIVSHSSGGMISSFDYNIKIPEPGVVFMLGAGLLFVGWAGRRRIRA